MEGGYLAAGGRLFSCMEGGVGGVSKLPYSKKITKP